MNKNKLWSNETFVRAVSLLIAVVLWMYVVSIDNPQINATIRNVPIQIVNMNNVKNSGLEIISMSDEKIDVKITGRMSDVSDVTSDDISVQLDVSNIYSANSYYIRPDVKINVNGISVAGTSIESVNVYADYISRVEKEIFIEADGKPKEGYTVASLSSTTNKVIISGPQGIINRIDKAKAIVDVSGISKELNKVCEIKLYSSNGEEIISDKVKLSETAISVVVNCSYSKTVPIVIDVEETFMEKYNIIISVPEIEILGDEELLKNVSQISAHIENLTFDDEEAITSNTWEASLIIPEGMTIKDEIENITVNFEKK